MLVESKGKVQGKHVWQKRGAVLHISCWSCKVNSKGKILHFCEKKKPKILFCFSLDTRYWSITRKVKWHWSLQVLRSTNYLHNSFSHFLNLKCICDFKSRIHFALAEPLKMRHLIWVGCSFPFYCHWSKPDTFARCHLCNSCNDLLSHRIHFFRALQSNPRQFILNKLHVSNFKVGEIKPPWFSWIPTLDRFAKQFKTYLWPKSCHNSHGFSHQYQCLLE